PGLDEQQERWSRQQRVPPHPVDGHAEDHERVEERPRDSGDHRHDRRFGHRGPHQRGPPREPPRVRRDEGPGHAQRALDRDAPGVLEVLEQRFMDGPNPVRPPFYFSTCVRLQDAKLLAYEGHDVKKGPAIDPKSTDQPWTHPDGKPTDNAKFAGAVDGTLTAMVRVYEKLRPGIWSDKGLFDLMSYEYTTSGQR